MKKIALTTALLLMLAVTYAQTFSRLIGTRTDVYNLSSSTWSYTDSMLHLYDEHANDTAQYAYDWRQATWKQIGAYLYSFDTQNRRTDLIIAAVDTVTGARTNAQRQTQSYNTNGDTITASYLQWNAGTNSWTNVYRYFYFKDVTHKDSFALIQLYNGGVWKNYASLAYAYNSSGKLLTRTQGNYNSGGTYVNNQRLRYTYDSNGLLAIEVKQNWDGATSAWISEERHNYTWTGNFITESKTDTYNTSTSAWEADSLNTMGYDASGNLTSLRVIRYNSNTSVYDSIGRTTYSYNADNTMSCYEQDIWVNNLWKHKYHYTYQYNAQKQVLYEYDEAASGNTGIYDPSLRKYYYYGDVSTAINEVEQAQTVNLYPNPATTKVMIAIGVELTQGAQIMVYDISGRDVAMQQPVISGGSSVELDVAPLASGVYTVAILDRNGNRLGSSRLVKQ